MAIINYPQLDSAGPYTIGGCHIDHNTGQLYVWTGAKWELVEDTDSLAQLIPTIDELAEHPSLKQAWEEYLVIRKLLGI